MSFRLTSCDFEDWATITHPNGWKIVISGPDWKNRAEELFHWMNHSPTLWQDLSYDQKLAATEHVFAEITRLPRCSFRKLIYDRLGFGPDDYSTLYAAGGQDITNAMFEHFDDWGTLRPAEIRKYLTSPRSKDVIEGLDRAGELGTRRAEGAGAHETEINGSEGHLKGQD